MLNSDQFVVYGGTGNHDFDEEVIRLLNLISGSSFAFTDIWYETWPDGEPGFYLEKTERIAGKHAIIFACPVNNKLENQLRDIITACKYQYGAKSVTVVLSFLRYRRQDRSELVYEITRLRWFLCNLKHYGADNLVVCDPHSREHTEKFAAEFGLNLFVADPTRLFAEALSPLVQGLGGIETFRAYSPDLGSVGRSIALAKALNITVIATPKKRIDGEIRFVEDASFLDAVYKMYGTEVEISCRREDVTDMNLIMREDELDSGGTAKAAALKLREYEPRTLHFIFTHPACSRGWKKKITSSGSKGPFDTIWSGNTRPRGDVFETKYEGRTGNRVQHISIEPVIAETLYEVLRNIS